MNDPLPSDRRCKRCGGRVKQLGVDGSREAHYNEQDCIEYLLGRVKQLEKRRQSK